MNNDNINLENMTEEERDLHFMRLALEAARRAAERDEVPVGALIVHDGEPLTVGENRREGDRMATHHAEVLAIEEACRVLGGWRLPRCTLYVTLEPCPMCAGAIVNSRIDRVVFGAYDARAGAFGSVTNLTELPLNHKPQIVGGVLADECAEILREYFRAKRKN